MIGGFLFYTSVLKKTEKGVNHYFSMVNAK